MKTQKGVEVPAECAGVLKKNKAALAAFEALPPSHQREYSEAIVGAKKPETRQRKINGAIKMILEWSSKRQRSSRKV